MVKCSDVRIEERKVRRGKVEHILTAVLHSDDLPTLQRIAQAIQAASIEPEKQQPSEWAKRDAIRGGLGS